jgi:hypothetical protein
LHGLEQSLAYTGWRVGILLAHDADHCRAAVNHIEFARRSAANVDDAPTAIWAAKLGMNLQSSTLKDDETGEPLHVQQRKQIEAYRAAWKEAGHTREPRYVRGKLGTIERDHGVFVFPDTNAHFLGEKPQHVYSVRFAACELWGNQAAPQDSVYVDLWDDHLEPP